MNNKKQRNWLHMFAVLQGIIEGSIARAEEVQKILSENGNVIGREGDGKLGNADVVEVERPANLEILK